MEKSFDLASAIMTSNIKSPIYHNDVEYESLRLVIACIPLILAPSGDRDGEAPRYLHIQGLRRPQPNNGGVSLDETCLLSLTTEVKHTEVSDVASRYQSIACCDTSVSSAYCIISTGHCL